MAKYRTVKLVKGANGWGGPLYVTPDDEKKYIISMTGGGIHPIAKKIAELTGAEAIDAFRNPVKNEHVACAVIDCGGTLRCGIYPKNNILTINVNPGGPTGPLAEYCKENLYVSDGSLDSISLAEGEDWNETIADEAKDTTITKTESMSYGNGSGMIGRVSNVAVGLGKVISRIVNLFYDGARRGVDMMLKTMLPFMAFVSIIFALVTATGIGQAFADAMSGLLGSVPGLVVFATILAIPVLSPLLGPGGVMESVIGAMIGQMIAAGTFPVNLAIAAYATVNVVSGCDFIAVGMSMGEADPDTIRLGVPASLFTRFLTAPIGVLLGWVVGMGMF